MRVVSIVGLKAGAPNLRSLRIAVAAHHAGILTAVVDTDPQATLRMWSSRRQIGGPPVRPETTPDFLEPTLKEFEKQGAELVLIDTAGKAEIMGKRAAELSDLVLIPSRPRSRTWMPCRLRTRWRRGWQAELRPSSPTSM